MKKTINRLAILAIAAHVASCISLRMLGVTEEEWIKAFWDDYPNQSTSGAMSKLQKRLILRVRLYMPLI
jgi:hypothetical protein